MMMVFIILSFWGESISAIAQDDFFFRKPWNPEGFRLTQGYNIYNPSYNGVHAGIDVVTRDRQIITTAPGKVVLVVPLCSKQHTHGKGQGCTDAGFGNTVIIEHELEDGGKIYSLYAHLEEIDRQIKKDSPILADQIIGKMGASGYGQLNYWTEIVKAGVHLHFEIKNGPPRLTDPKTGQYYGYVPKGKHPDDFGYHNPYNFFEKKRVKRPPSIKSVWEKILESISNFLKKKIEELGKAFEKKIEEETEKKSRELEREARKCCAAQSAYGSSLTSDLDILRELRDKILSKNNFGSKLMNFYYNNLSPLIVDFNSKYPTSKVITKEIFIRPMIKVLIIAKNIRREYNNCQKIK